MEERTAFRYDVLAVLYDEGTLHGLGIKSELQDRYEKYQGDVNHGRLYPNLDDMVENGLIEKSQADKRTNHYELSGEGVNVLKDRIEQLGGDA